MKNPDIEACLASKKRVRTVDPFSVLDKVVRTVSASKSGFTAGVVHGGGVPNSYNYPADSECVGVAAVRTHGTGGRAYLGYARIRANKITEYGAAKATIGVGGMWRRGGSNTIAEETLYLRNKCWEIGDIIWKETALGGIYYKAEGYGWRKAGMQAYTTNLTVAQMVRIMRRLTPTDHSLTVKYSSGCADLHWKRGTTGFYHNFGSYIKYTSGKVKEIVGIIVKAMAADRKYLADHTQPHRTTDERNIQLDL